MSRIFVALPISASLQDTIASWQQGYSDLPVRWLAGKNLHLTIVPPWEEQAVESVVHLLQKFEGYLDELLALNFKRVNFGPSPYEPRLIWATGEAPPAVPKLIKDLSLLLGQPLPDREFRLHLTLARFRSEQFQTFPIKHLDSAVNWKETVRFLVLLESHLLPQGAEYQALTEIQLVKPEKISNK